MVLLFIGDLKNHLGPGVRNPKRSNYEMGARVKIYDQLGIRLFFLIETWMVKRGFLSRFLKDPFKNTC
jgi:hypothetical protein